MKAWIAFSVVAVCASFCALLLPLQSRADSPERYVMVGTDGVLTAAINAGTNGYALAHGVIKAIDTGSATQLVWIVAGVTNVIDADASTP